MHRYYFALILCTAALTACQEERYVGSLLDYPGVKDGRIKAYTADNVLREEANYVRDTLHGTRTLYHPNGQIEVRESYQMGTFHGPYETYFDNGQMKMKGQYLDNEMVEVWTYYYPSGQKKAELTMKENMENGPFSKYYPNGHIEARGQYKGGDFEDGDLLLYDSTGVLVKRMLCEKGKCYTQWTLDQEE